MSQLEKVLVSPIGKFSQRLPVEEYLIWPNSQALVPQDAQLWAGSSLEHHGLSLNAVADPEGAIAGGCLHSWQVVPGSRPECFISMTETVQPPRCADTFLHIHSRGDLLWVW